MYALIPVTLCLALTPQDDTSTRSHDLRAILASGAPLRDDLSRGWQLPSIDEIYAADQSLGALDDAPVTSAECVAAARAAAASSPGAVVEQLVDQGETLVVTGNGAAHAAIAEALESIEAHALTSVFVEAFFVEPWALGDDRAAVLSGKRATEVSDAAKEARRILGWVQLGRQTQVGEETMAQYLQDYDTDVAQSALGIDPTVNRVFSGTRTTIRVDRSHDGQGLIARVQGRTGRRIGAMRTRRIQAFGRAVVEHPVLDAALFAASATLEPGGALVIDPGHPDRRLLVVRLVTDMPSRRADDPMVDLGWLLAPPQRLGPIGLSEVQPSRGLDPSDDEPERRSSPWSAARPELSDVLSGLVGEGAPMSAQRVGTGALVHGAESRRSLRRAIDTRSLEEGVRTIEVASATTVVSGSDLALAMTDAAHLAELCARARVRRSGSVLAGDTLALGGGTLTSHIQDQDVQISNSILPGDPILAQVMDGGSLWCSPLRIEEGRIRAWFDASQQDGFARPRIIETFFSSPAMGNPGMVAATLRLTVEHLEDLSLTIGLELGSTSRIHGRALLDLVPGQWEILAVQPSGDGGNRLIAVRARLLDG